MKFVRSFDYAFQGIRYCFRTQFNFRVQSTAACIAIAAGFLLHISPTEWLFIILCSTLVLILEMINTAIEQLCDLVTMEVHPLIKTIKDVSAAAVLLAAAASVATGLIIFLPKITDLLH